jgi:hypothetical protein
MGQKPRKAVPKRQVTPPLPPPPPQPTSADGRITVSVRLPMQAHEQLREIAFYMRTTKAALLAEGLNLIFERHGKPAIPFS